MPSHIPSPLAKRFFSAVASRPTAMSECQAWRERYESVSGLIGAADDPLRRYLQGTSALGTTLKPSGRSV
jgi:hypothetical protein